MENPALECDSSLSKFSVRCANSLEDFSPVFDYMVKEGWPTAVGDVEAFYAIDPSGCFVGELDGKKIAFLSTLKYPEKKICFDGQFVVDPAYRGKGYGREMMHFSSKTFPGDYNRGGDAVLNMTQTYEKYWGYKDCGWLINRYIVQVVNIPNTEVPANIKLQPIKGFDCEELCEYEEKVIGLHRKSFMEKWINLPGRYGWVAVSQGQSIVGYVVCRPIESSSHAIAPLYANNPDIASCLLSKAATTALDGNSKVLAFSVDVSTPNDQAVKLMKNELKGSLKRVFNRMFSKGLPPNVAPNKIFCVASTDVL